MEVGVDDDVEIAMDRGRFAYGAISDNPPRFVPFTVSSSRVKVNRKYIFHPVIVFDDVLRTSGGKPFVVPIYGDHLSNFLDLFEFVLRKFPIVVDEESGAKLLSAIREEVLTSNRFCDSTIEDVKRHPKKRVCYSYPMTVETGKYIVEFSFDTQRFIVPDYSVLAVAISLYDINQVNTTQIKLSKNNKDNEEAIGIVYIGSVVVTNALCLYRSLKPFDEMLKEADDG